MPIEMPEWARRVPEVEGIFTRKIAIHVELKADTEAALDAVEKELRDRYEGGAKTILAQDTFRVATSYKIVAGTVDVEERS